MASPVWIQLEAPPKALRHKEAYAYLPPKMGRDHHELALTLAWICNRQLFGRTYSSLQPEYFWDMPHGSGVLLRPVVTTSKISPGAIRPGDIDLLVIPYHGDELVLEQTLVLEIKAVRATFAKQGKSPNEFGFSQAEGLSALGFPYVGLVHLIVSDQSPEHAWRMMGRAEILDEEGRVRLLPSVPHDMLPADLMDRTFGRLEGNSRNPDHGLAAVYLEPWSEEFKTFRSDGGYWLPTCRRAQANGHVSNELLLRVGRYYKKNASSFLATPRFDP